MIHRAILGSFERFIGILIENYAGKFPLWLAPMQMVVATITNDSDSYANEVLEKLNVTDKLLNKFKKSRFNIDKELYKKN